MTQTERTLFLQFSPSQWDDDELQATVDQIDAVTPENTQPIMLPRGGFEALDKSEVKSFATNLLETVEE